MSKHPHSTATCNLLFAAGLAVSAALGCGRFRLDPGPQAPEQPQLRRDAQRPEGQPPAAKNSDNDGEGVLYGTWAGTGIISGMSCRTESIFESTGTYSGAATCDNGFGGTYMTRSVGDWRLIQPGMIRIEYTDHEPKEFQGQRIHYPTGETVNFTMPDRDHLVTVNGTLTRRF